MISELDISMKLDDEHPDDKLESKAEIEEGNAQNDGPLQILTEGPAIVH